MTSDNTLSKSGFLLRQFLWLLMLWVPYRTYLFRILPGFTYLGSIGILAACAVGFTLLGILFALRKHRNELSIFTSLGFGYGLYYLLTCGHLHKTMILVSLAVFLLAGILISLAVLFSKFRNPKKKGREIGRRLKKVFAIMLTSVSLSIFSSFTLDGIYGAITQFRTAAKSSAAPETEKREAMIDANIAVISRFHKSRWNDCSAEEKLQALQAVADIEQAHLGLKEELTVVPETFKQGTTVAYYTDSDHMISFSESALQKTLGYECLNVICHEAFHSYQYALVSTLDSLDDTTRNLMMFQDAAKYQYEFSNYTTEQEDNEKYASQYCETDARKYAADAYQVYHKAIEKYLGIGE